MGTLLAQDIPGSTLTIAFQNAEQDSATRKFLVSSTGRADAIDTVTTALGSVNHPDESALKANRITAQAVGPSRWLVTVQYTRRRFGGIPSGGTTLHNMRASSEAVEVYCTPEQWKDGLPFGGDGKKFVNPGPPDGQSTDPANRPKAWVYNRPVISIQIPFSSATNPVSDSINQVSKVNASQVTLGGQAYAAGTVRYDGGEVRSIAPSKGSGVVRYFGTLNYTFTSGEVEGGTTVGGWHKQILVWENDQWIARNIRSYDTV
jgi:hypothetical protein